MHEWQALSEASSFLFEAQHWEALEIRVLEWFAARGVHAADPAELLEASEDRHKRSLSLHNSHRLSHRPALSSRIKMLSHLHITLDYRPAAAPPRLTDSC